MATKVEFEVEGSTVKELYDNAVAAAKQVAGNYKFEVTHSGPVLEADSSWVGSDLEPARRAVTRWRQEFVIKVDF